MDKVRSCQGRSVPGVFGQDASRRHAALMAEHTMEGHLGDPPDLFSMWDVREVRGMEALCEGVVSTKSHIQIYSSICFLIANGPK